eukprot:TRINITY_DN6359_c0_g1_i1.p1 TRINITY_DN6359_c0_g1~~TRINITY_DN6359_c0_g1_i1.p1  ORF type:complete len:244 (+),score=47.13 TRINITY_DN6359_c0_g1_i1:494-1225(+)
MNGNSHHGDNTTDNHTTTSSNCEDSSHETVHDGSNSTTGMCTPKRPKRGNPLPTSIKAPQIVTVQSQADEFNLPFKLTKKLSRAGKSLNSLKLAQIIMTPTSTPTTSPTPHPISAPPPTPNPTLMLTTPTSTSSRSETDGTGTGTGTETETELKTLHVTHTQSVPPCLSRPTLLSKKMSLSAPLPIPISPSSGHMTLSTPTPVTPTMTIPTPLTHSTPSNLTTPTTSTTLPNSPQLTPRMTQQ